MPLQFSRFKRTNLIKTRSGAETYGLMEGFDILRNSKTTDFNNYIVPGEYEGRPDLIAQHFLGSSFYEWMIVMSNRPKNPLGWPKVGQLIRIPNKTLLKSLL